MEQINNMEERYDRYHIRLFADKGDTKPLSAVVDATSREMFDRKLERMVNPGVVCQIIEIEKNGGTPIIDPLGNMTDGW
jgi:hypothetical protein